MRWTKPPPCWRGKSDPKSIPADQPDFIGTVPIFGFENLQKLGRPDFLKFQTVNIPVFEVIFLKDLNQYFSRSFFWKLRRSFLSRYEPYMHVCVTRGFWCGMQCAINLFWSFSSASTVFSVQWGCRVSFSWEALVWRGGGGGEGHFHHYWEQWWKCPDFFFFFQMLAGMEKLFVW